MLSSETMNMKQSDSSKHPEFYGTAQAKQLNLSDSQPRSEHGRICSYLASF